jgi:maltooligosyltrehalose trehalohydrolase
MGEEYGEDAPFQFFTDHVDKRIARATREGRRKEFADFAAFAGEEVPDPQSPETFERSKLTRREDGRLAALYRDLFALRPQLPDIDPDIAHDEAKRWLRVRRGPFELVMNFAPRRRHVPVTGSELVLATHDAVLEDGEVALPALGGAVVG